MLHQWTEIKNHRMENIFFHSKITCDRCGKEKPEGREALGWFSSKYQARSRLAFNLDPEESNGQVDICLNCQTEEEATAAAMELADYIHHHIWRDGSLIGRRIRAIETDQDALKKDCQKARELLEIFNPTNKQSLFNQIERALISARIFPEGCGEEISAHEPTKIEFKRIERRTS